MCCVCAGSCNHIGPHAYCEAHGLKYYNPFIYTTTTSPERREITLDEIQAALDKLGLVAVPKKQKRNPAARGRR